LPLARGGGQLRRSKQRNSREFTPMRLAAILSAIFLFTAPAFADDYPTKPIRVFTTSSAGGISDIFMRVLDDKLSSRLGQRLIIENRPGAQGNIAARVCSDAPPDGYTICIINTDTIAYNEFLFKHPGWNTQKGLIPIINLFHLIQVLVVNSDLNVKSVDDLIALSKAKPGTLNYLTASLPMVVYMERLHKERGADWVRVPFKGGGEATNAILAGTTPIGLIGLGNVISHIKAGKMTALALVNNIRTPQLPDTPTLADTGYKGPPSQTWYGLFAPAGMPRPIIDKLNKEITAVMKEPGFQEKYLISRGLVQAIGTPEEFSATIKTDREAAREVVKESGMEPQ
jgi:tripartite-type tricarboxylate transporter receptor subunit TctC